MSAGDGSRADAGDLLGPRMAQYVDLWESAQAKLTAGDYHAEDLVEDWFRWMGLVARDATAAVVVALGATPPTLTADHTGPRAPGDPHAPGEPGT